MVKLFSKNSNLCDHNSPTLQTDKKTTCDRNTALCTKVHRAVKTRIYAKHSDAVVGSEPWLLLLLLRAWWPWRDVRPQGFHHV